MGEVLPQKSSEFSNPAYWRRFFTLNKTPFEWYGDYAALGEALDKYLKPSDDILQIGCGNSRLATELHDVGYQKITSIDTDATVIEEQERTNKARPSLTFKCLSATQTGLDEASFSAVIDKGTLDALLPPDEPSASAIVSSMFDEITRVLALNGKYIVVTLAQEHIVRAWAEHFSKSRTFLLRVHKIDTSAGGFPMPVFLLVVTKLRAPMPRELPIDYVVHDPMKPTRFTSVNELLECIEGEQQLSKFVHLCSSKLDNEVSIVVSHSDGKDRYKIYMIDDPDVQRIRQFSVFIVPIGRDGDWLFATEKGRKSLRAQCKKDRLAMVTLFRDVHYESLEQIKEELAPLVQRLNPLRRQNGEAGPVEFLSMGKHNVKETIATGESALNGRWSVEDVIIREKVYRRLVFLSSQNLVQSEAQIKNTKTAKHVICLDELACEHHEVMLLSLALIPDSPLRRPHEVPFKVAVLGLGGGLLAAFLIRNFSLAQVAGVELDPDVVEIASKYFTFPAKNERMTVRVMDALDYLTETAGVSGEKQDALFVDLATSMTEEGLSCPPPAFLSTEVLQNMHDSLTDTGVLALNLVTRDEEVSAEVKAKVGVHFQTMFVIASAEDVNEVLIASKKAPIAFDRKKFAKSLPKHEPWMKSLGEKVERLTVLR